MTNPTACREAFEKWYSDLVSNPLARAYNNPLGMPSEGDMHRAMEMAWQSAWNTRTPEGEAVACESPLGGRWHHGAGYLVCGSFRVAKADWEASVCAADNLRERMFDWICATLNGKDEPSVSASDWDAWGIASHVRTELDKQSCPDHWMRIAVETVVTQLESHHRATSAEVESDAARYRWLRDCAACQWEHPMVVSQQRQGERMLYLGPMLGNGLDQAIDTAMAQRREPK